MKSNGSKIIGQAARNKSARRPFGAAKGAFFLAALFCALFCSCENGGKKKGSLKIVNWNAQTFFDANNDGIEYSNFIKSKSWNEAAYKERLQKLCKAIEALDGDLVILEEIENQGIVYDISNALAGAAWNPAKAYRYACFAKKENSSIGCAVLSRRALAGMKVHSLDVRSEAERSPSMRPLIEIDLAEPKALKIFVNHWKSKAGVGDSALWRRWQEGLLAQKINEARKENPQAAILCAGDFNQDIGEFCLLREADAEKGGGDFGEENSFEGHSDERGANVALRPLLFGDDALVYSPWLDFGGQIGSYYFRDNWERIDHFFVCGTARVRNFSPRTGEWSRDDGTPKAFKLYSLSGWSDHLPIFCRVEF